MGPPRANPFVIGLEVDAIAGVGLVAVMDASPLVVIFAFLGGLGLEEVAGLCFVEGAGTATEGSSASSSDEDEDETLELEAEALRFVDDDLAGASSSESSSEDEALESDEDDELELDEEDELELESDEELEFDPAVNASLTILCVRAAANNVFDESGAPAIARMGRAAAVASSSASSMLSSELEPEADDSAIIFF